MNHRVYCRDIRNRPQWIIVERVASAEEGIADDVLLSLIPQEAGRLPLSEARLLADALLECIAGIAAEEPRTPECDNNL